MKPWRRNTRNLHLTPAPRDMVIYHKPHHVSYARANSPQGLRDAKRAGANASDVDARISGGRRPRRLATHEGFGVNEFPGPDPAKVRWARLRRLRSRAGNYRIHRLGALLEYGHKIGILPTIEVKPSRKWKRARAYAPLVRKAARLGEPLVMMTQPRPGNAHLDYLRAAKKANPGITFLLLQRGQVTDTEAAEFDAFKGPPQNRANVDRRTKLIARSKTSH